MDNRNKLLCVVNEKDEIIGTQKAIVAHHKDYIKLHRAFSVFIINSKGELLLQKRSLKKLVFPGLWTNTCCSHPFINENSFKDPVKDCKNHAISRLEYELGITDVRAEDLRFVGRIEYKATETENYGRIIDETVKPQSLKVVECESDVSNFEFKPENFCEYEIDYIFVCQADPKIKINDSEVESVIYISKAELNEFLKINDCSPWIRQIMKNIDVFKALEMNKVLN